MRVNEGEEGVKSMWEMKLPPEFVSQAVCLHVHASISYSKMSCSATVGHTPPELCQYYLWVAHTGESVIVFHLYVQLLALPCTMILTQKVQFPGFTRIIATGVHLVASDLGTKQL